MSSTDADRLGTCCLEVVLAGGVFEGAVVIAAFCVADLVGAFLDFFTGRGTNTFLASVTGSPFWQV